MIDWLNNITILFERGGPILWAILAASILMWVLILEAYRVFFFDLKPHRRQVLRRWETTKWRNNPPKNYLLTRMQTAFEAPIRRHLKLISVLVEILPLLGLLGTITGMIKVFDVITLFGAGNARAMAAGISEALITTMAGLVTALSGFYFSVNLKSMNGREAQAFQSRLKACNIEQVTDVSAPSAVRSEKERPLA